MSWPMHGLPRRTSGFIVDATSEALSFVPDSVLSRYDDPDAEHTYFGWWLMKPESQDAAHTVQVFFGGTTGHEVGAVAAGRWKENSLITALRQASTRRKQPKPACRLTPIRGTSRPTHH